MASLAFCLKKIGIKGAEADYLISRSKAYQDASGMTREEADATVAKEWIKELEGEYGSIVDQVQQQGLKAPKEERRQYDQYTREVWESVADKIPNVETAREIIRELIRKVYTDELTGIGSRAGFFEQVAKDEKLPVNQRRNIVMLDLDNFSFVNDVLGHGAGDDVLRVVGKVLREHGIDPYRIGGEEFALLVKDDREARQAAMNIQRILEEDIYVTQQLREPRRLKSNGVQYDAKETITINGIGASYGIDKIYKRADERLQTEKESRESEGLRAAKGTEIKRLRRERPDRAGKGAEEQRIQREGVFARLSVARRDTATSNPFNTKNWSAIDAVAEAPDVEISFSAPKDPVYKTGGIEGLKSTVITGMETTGSLKAGSTMAKTPAQAASLLAHIRKSPQENLYIVPVNKRGKVLEIHRYTKGVAGSAPGSVTDLAGYVFNMPDVDRVYVAHNHPSGNAMPSPEDLQFMEVLGAALELGGAEIQPLVIGGTKWMPVDRLAIPEDIPAAYRNKKMKIRERTFALRLPGEKADNSKDAFAVKNDLFGSDAEGFMLMDHQNQVVGFYEYPKGLSVRQASVDLIRVLEKTNASAMAFFDGSSSLDQAVAASRSQFIKDLTDAVGGFAALHDYIAFDGQKMKSIRDSYPNAGIFQRKIATPQAFQNLKKADVLLSLPPQEKTGSAAIKEKWTSRGVQLDLYEGYKIDLQNIIVPPAKRKQGIGTQILNELIDHADRVGKRIELTPATKDDYHGTTSRKRLERFYKRFGFLPNRGRNKDYTISAGMYREPQVNRPTALPPDSAAFKMWFGKSLVTYDGTVGGEPMVLFHGSTHNAINVFRTGDESYADGMLGNENYLGPGAYFTNEWDDVNENYAGEGADLRLKIERLQEQYQDLDRWAEEDILREYFTKRNMEEELRELDEATEADEGWEYDNEPLQQFLDKHWEDALDSHVREQIVGDAPGGVVYPVYIKMENPFDMEKTFLDYTIEFDEAGEDIVSEGGPAEDLINEIIQRIIGMDTDGGLVTDLRSELYQTALDNDGLTGDDVMEAMNASGVIVMDDYGNMLSYGAILREAVETMGYDGIIMNAGKHFGPRAMMGQRFPGMPGVYSHTKHFLPFRANQIKSAIGNVGTFDANKDDIRFSVKHGYGKQTEFDFQPSKQERMKTLKPWLRKYNYPYAMALEVKMLGMEPFIDGMTGMNLEHIKARARDNWGELATFKAIGDIVPVEDVDEIDRRLTLGPDALSLEDAADPIRFSVIQRLAEKKWPDVPFEKTRFFIVNNRVSRELQLFELLFGASEHAIEVPGQGRKPTRSIMPSNLLTDLYRVVETGEVADLLDRRNDPMEIAISRGLSKRSPGKTAQGKRLRSPAEDFVHFLNKIRKTQLLLPVDEKGKPILTENAKAGASGDLLLAFCDPTEQCIVCYAAARMLREDVIVKSFRNSLFLLSSPDGYAKQMATEAAALRRPEYPFIRLLGSGDLTTIEQIKAYNYLAKKSDRPIHIFSRHHEMLRRLKGNSTAPFFKMGSIDASLYLVYGHDFLVDNLAKHGISNAWLYLSESEMPTLKALRKDKALGLILSATPELHATLPKNLRQIGCPCDAEERHFLSSCRQCALSQMGCMTAFNATGIDSRGKLWQMEDPKRPKKIWPVLTYLQKADVMTVADFINMKAKTVAERKLLVDRAKIELGKDPEGLIVTPTAQGYLDAAIRLIDDSMKKLRAQIKAFSEGKKKQILLYDLRWPNDMISVPSLTDAEYHMDFLKYLRDQAVMGKAYLPGGEIQMPVAIKAGQILADASLITREKARLLDFSVKARENDAKYLPEDIEAATRSARVKGAIGPKAKVPKVVARLAKTGDRILDFGAGIVDENGKLPHVEALRKRGLNVTAYEFGDNAHPDVHDANALDKRYDIVYGSNVLNVQSRPSMFERTLEQMVAATSRKGGQLVVNMPRDPRYGFLGNMSYPAAKKYLRRLLRENFTSVEKATDGKKGMADVYVASGKRPVQFSVQQAAKRVSDNPAFKEWFGDSKVVNKDGTPRIVYHGTDSPTEFKVFQAGFNDVGIHFGTAGQANDRLEYILMQRQYQGRKPRLYPVYLKMENPLRLPDVGFFDIFNLPFALGRTGLFDADVEAQDLARLKSYEYRYYEIEEDTFSFRTNEGREYALLELQREFAQEAAEVIKGLGYDGIVYKNTGEIEGMAPLMRRILHATGEERSELYRQKEALEKSDKVQDSYMVFDSNQVKSIFNRGTFETTTPDIMMSVYHRGWRMQMESVLEKKLPNKGPVATMLKTIEQFAKKGEFKAEELEWSGVLDAFEAPQPSPLFPKFASQKEILTKKEILDFLKYSRLEIGEVVLSDQGVYDDEYIQEEAWEYYISEDIGHNLRQLVRRNIISEDEKLEWDDKFADASDDYVAGDPTTLDGLIENFNAEYEDDIDYRIIDTETAEDSIREREEERDDGSAKPKYRQYSVEPIEDYHELIITLESPSGENDEHIYEIQALKSSLNRMTDDFERYTAELEQLHPISKYSTYSSAHEMQRPVPMVDRGLAFDIMSKRNKLAQEISTTKDNLAALEEKYIRPEIGEFSDHHWTDVYDEDGERLSNPFVHIRFQEKTTVDGKRVLFIEEIQSDWHQKGRKMGYTDPVRKGFTEKYKGKYEEYRHAGMIEDVAWEDLTHGERMEFALDNQETGSYPYAPMRKTQQWMMLGFKRMVKWATNNGYDRIGWTTGAIQSIRYPHLRKVVKELQVQRKGKPDNYSYALGAVKRDDGKEHFLGEFKAHELPNVVGKMMADKILENDTDAEQSYTGDDLLHDLGGPGMVKFYDAMLVNEVSKMFNKKTWGSTKVYPDRIQARGYQSEPDRFVLEVMPQSLLDYTRADALGFSKVNRAMSDMTDDQTYKLAVAVREELPELFDGEASLEMIPPEELKNLLREQFGNGGSAEADAFVRNLIGLEIMDAVRERKEAYRIINEVSGGQVWFDDPVREGVTINVSDDRAYVEKVIEERNEAAKENSDLGLKIWMLDVTYEMREKAKDLPFFSTPVRNLAPARQSIVMAEAMEGLGTKAIEALTLRETGVPFWSDYFDRHSAKGAKASVLRRQYAALYGEPEKVMIGGEEAYIGKKYLTPRLAYRAMFSSPLKGDPQIRPIADEYVKMIKNTMPPPVTGKDLDVDVFEGLRPEVRARIEQKGGLKKPPFMGRLKEMIVGTKNAFTRAYRHLDPAEYGALSDVLRLHGEVNENAGRRAAEALTNILHGLQPKQYGAFRMAIIMDDMMRDIDSGLLSPDESQTYPFGFESKQEAQAFRDRVQSVAQADPLVASALQRRDKFNRELKQILVDNNLLKESVLEDDRYFHHQVLLYRAVTSEGDEGYLGVGLGRRMQYRKKGWQMARKGSLLDYNTDYAQAEYEVIAQAFQQLESVGTLNRVKELTDATERLKMIAKAEGREDWQEVAKERGYVPWKPTPNTAWYKASTITDKIIDQIMAGEITIDEAEFREVWLKGKDAEWWVKPEVAKTLDEYGQIAKETNKVSKVTASLQRAWKAFMLISPFRFFKYNLNNMSGDLDIAFAYRPGMILRPKYFAKALLDITREYRQTGRPTWTSRAIDLVLGKSKPHTQEIAEELELAKRLGVIGSGWSAQELSELSKKMEFEEAIRAFTENPGKIKALFGASKYAVWGRQKNITQARENILRLAAWRWFKDQLAAGNKVYGVSKRAEVDAVTDLNEKAAKLGRELVGDYGNISEAGQWIRKQLMPFYSWIEVNSPRYFRLIGNLKHEGASTAMLPVAFAWKGTKLAMKMVAFMALVSLWNRTFFPDEEEELPESQRRQLHLILGRRSDGSVRTLRVQGAFSDLLSMAGAEDFPTDVKEFVEGSKTGTEWAKETALAIPYRAFHSVRPEWKTAYSLLTRKTFYPDPLNPRPVRDRMEEIFRMWALDKPYRFVAGKPRRGDTAMERLWGDITSMVYYNSDPGESAYYQSKAWTYDFMDKIGEERKSSYTPDAKSSALYYYRQALKFGDIPSAQKYLNLYVQKYGGTPKGLQQSIKRAHPLSMVPSKYRNQFYSVLTPHQAKVIDMAIEWYHLTYEGPTAQKTFDQLQWPEPKGIDEKTLNDIRLGG